MTGTRQRRRGPSGPLVFDVRELGRRPGSVQAVVKRAAVPADLGTEMLAVPGGADLDLDIRLESVVEGVLVSGDVRAPLAGVCARCLDSVEQEAVVELRELFFYPERAMDDDSDSALVVDDHVDVEPAIRDALVLNLPLSPHCRPDCAGLCADCGIRLDDAEPNHSHPLSDPRWAALSSLTETKEED
jgi:uncharacterized protein